MIAQPSARACTYNQLESDNDTVLGELAALDAPDDARPRKPGASEVDLLDALPHLRRVNLARAPEHHLRRLFEITKLAVRLHPDNEHVTIEVTLPADELTQIADVAQATSKPTAADAPNTTACSDPVGAPNGVRTTSEHDVGRVLRLSATVESGVAVGCSNAN